MILLLGKIFLLVKNIFFIKFILEKKIVNSFTKIFQSFFFVYISLQMIFYLILLEYIYWKLILSLFRKSHPSLLQRSLQLISKKVISTLYIKKTSNLLFFLKKASNLFQENIMKNFSLIFFLKKSRLFKRWYLTFIKSNMIF